LFSSNATFSGVLQLKGSCDLNTFVFFVADDDIQSNKTVGTYCFEKCLRTTFVPVKLLIFKMTGVGNGNAEPANVEGYQQHVSHGTSQHAKKSARKVANVTHQINAEKSPCLDSLGVDNVCLCRPWTRADVNEAFKKSNNCVKLWLEKRGSA
jgi:hypothetical protein